MKAPATESLAKVTVAILLALLVLWPQPLSWVYLNLGSIEANRYLVGQESAVALRAAEENLTAAVSMGVTRAYRQLGRLQLQRGDYASAGQSLEHWEVLHPEDTLGHWTLGRIYEAEGNREAAIAEWKDAEAFHQLMRLGDEEAERGRWNQAIDLYHAAAEVAATRSNRVLAQRWDYVVERGWEAHQRLGSALWRGLGDVEEAQRQYEWAAILAPWNLNLYTDVAGLYEHSGDWDAAAQWLERALTVDPANAGLLTLISSNRLQAGDTVSAATWARRALKEDPTNAAVWVTLGRALLAQGENAAAATALEQAIKAAGPSPELYAWLAVSQRAVGNLEKAEKAYLDGLALRPTDLDLLRSLSAVYMEQGQAAKAVKYLGLAAQAYPANLDTLLELAAAQRQLGNKAEARRLYLRVIDLAPDDQRAKRGLASLDEPP
jgi:tetratricopeptide (TPR) repeat protein